MGESQSPAESPPRPGPRRDVLFLVFTTILIDFTGFSVLIPVLPLFAQRLGASPTQIGLILTIYALAQLLFLPAWGWVSDRIGRRPVLLVSLAGTVASFALLAAADSIGMIYTARALAGFFAASIGTAQAVVTDVTPRSERARGMGLIGAAFGASMILGPLLGGALAHLGEKLPFHVIAVLALCNLILAWLRLPETSAPDRTPPRWAELGHSLVPPPLRLVAAVHETRIGLFLYLFFHLFTAFAVLEGMITYFLGRKFGATELEVAGIFAWIGLFLVVTQGLLLHRLDQRLGEERLVALGLVAMGIGLLGVAVAPSFAWFYAVGPLIAFGNGVAFPSFTSLYSKAVSARQAGEFLAQSQSMATTGRIVGPFAAGWVMQSWSDEAPFLVAGVMMFAALLIFQLFRRILLEGPV
jgi:multidrug resistance protein